MSKAIVNGSTTSALVSATDITKYQRDGVVVLRNVLTQNVIAELSDALAQNMQSPGPWANEYAANSQQGRFFDDYVNWSRFDAYKTHALAGVLPQIALALMQKTSGRFFHEHVLVKESGNNQVTPWHNDEPYYGIDSINNVSLWVPLDPIPEKIALRAIAGSHKWGKKFIPRKFVDQSPYVASASEYEPLPDSKSLMLPTTSKVLRQCLAISSHFIFERYTAHLQLLIIQIDVVWSVFAMSIVTLFGQHDHGRLHRH